MKWGLERKPTSNLCLLDYFSSHFPSLSSCHSLLCLYLSCCVSRAALFCLLPLFPITYTLNPMSAFHSQFFTAWSFFVFPFLSFIFSASSLLYFSCGPNSPITAGGNYAWKLIRCSLNNYPLMQLIDFPFQELCFLSPVSAFLSPQAGFPFEIHCFWAFFLDK